MRESKSVSAASTQELDRESVLAAIEQSLAMIQFDLQGYVLWANDNFAMALGYRSEELIGMQHRRFCTPEFAASPAYRDLWEGLGNGRAFQDKIMRVTKDGRLIWLEAAYMPIMNEHGQAQAVLKIATDINAREQATTKITGELLHMSEELLSRANEGIARSQEVESAIAKAVQGAGGNIESLLQLERQIASIRGIVRTIREVASQTTLLSLNAAIEAAHAGEHGRGFNVVASEVRKLAAQVQEAAKEVGGYVEGIIAHVQEMAQGTKHSQQVVAESQHRIRLALNEFMSIGEASRLLDAQAKELGAAMG
ncbi:methyl-accepting chemotaxis protein [Paenibacillus sacheonensis]|uniref:PAS domain S-box protein n=1 Tax=Paenibacillus sacheonensis TaxID=742054 RepID=A0A7X4YS99_9BACL|nr:methyl-accepting chemotaxis protein [Paenibacillus sacheonensis]MBM7567826.1 PAS domain S-box-containing protein [Paenibacillus sacheonensis]NBC70716.1 PAS domain S-box protein [Paenibacillus sacheonensis]